MQMGLGLGLTRGAVVAYAAALVASDSNAFAADFTNPTDERRILVKTGTTPAYHSPSDLITIASAPTQPTIVKDRAGAESFVPHNFYLNSDTPATQTRTLVLGATYTVSVVGSGSIALSNAGTGTVTEGNPVTFTAASTSLVSTLTGTLTRMQLNMGGAVLDYVATTGAAKVWPAITYDADLADWVLLIEPLRTNSLLNSTAPVTQTVSLAAATYTLWIEGSGSVALSGGPTGTATEGSPVTFTLGSTTSVTFTITGDVTFFQCENGSVPTSKIITYGASQTRQRSDGEMLLSAIPSLGTAYTVYLDFAYAGSTASSQFLWTTGSGIGEYAGLRIDNLTPRLLSRSASADVASITTPAITHNSRQQVTAHVQANKFMVSGNAYGLGNSGYDYSGVLHTAGTKFYFGGQLGGQSVTGPLRIRRIAIIPGDTNGYDVVSRYADATTDPTAYDIFLIAGQSNNYTSQNELNALEDVSGGSVWQMSQANGSVSAANEPLAHPVPLASNMGYPLVFARDHYQPVAGTQVLLLPSAVADTGFSDNRWNSGNDLHNLALGICASAIARFPNSTFKGVLWHQGEKDAQAAVSQATHAANMDAAFAAFRAKLGNVPIMVGGLGPDFIAVDAATRQAVQDAIEDTPNRLSKVGYADSSGLSDGTDANHFSRANQIILGGRYYTAYQAAL